ncbi:MAG: CapA family protein [Eubacterium sp.]|nr:CapA family protein [Eubacterium sp.]MCC8173796.1 CapA family protein [Odoribacter sp.]
MPAKIIIGADIVPTESNQNFFVHACMKDIIHPEILRIISNADYRIFNLEVPLTDIEAPIEKCGPNLIAPIKAIEGYKELGIDFLTLANNHIMDQGEQGLRSTVNMLDTVNIAHAGAGKNLREAGIPHIFECGGKKIGIYCCAEHEFSIAGEYSPGANPFDPLESLDHIVNLDQKCDFVICLYHGGKEHYRYPSPRLQKVCRKIAEKGADLIICQHSHCIGCEEKWAGSTIVYGQGNFLFDRSDSEFWRTSLLIVLDAADNFTINYVPIEKNGKGISFPDDKTADTIIAEFNKRSEEICREDFVNNNYSHYAVKSLEDYIVTSDCLSRTFLYRIAKKICKRKAYEWLVRFKLKTYRDWLINQYSCEAHRELIIKGLEVSQK